MTEQAADSVEQVLRDELARGDTVIATARPILRHLLTHDEGALFSDELVARVRGMVIDVAGQLLFAQAAAADAGDRSGYVAARSDRLEQLLCGDAAFLAHLHALALEADLLERLQARSAIDPVLTPLINDRLVSNDAETAGRAMAVLAAQARFQQQAGRMELPLNELPGDVFNGALVLARAQAGDGDRAAEAAERQLREDYREGAGRLGQLARLVVDLGPDGAAALRIEHAGVSVFASALSLASGQDRDRVMLSLAERPGTRLALALRAAGVDPRDAIAQLLHLHPGVTLPDGFEALRADRAAALLASLPPRVGA